MLGWTGEGVSGLVVRVEIIPVGGDKEIALRVGGIVGDVGLDVGIEVEDGRVGLTVVGAVVGWTGAGRSGLVVDAKISPVGDSVGVVGRVGGIVGDVWLYVSIEVGAG